MCYSFWNPQYIRTCCMYFDVFSRQASLQVLMLLIHHWCADLESSGAFNSSTLNSAMLLFTYLADCQPASSVMGRRSFDNITNAFCFFCIILVSTQSYAYFHHSVAVLPLPFCRCRSSVPWLPLPLRVKTEMLETSFHIHRDEETRMLIGCPPTAERQK